MPSYAARAVAITLCALSPAIAAAQQYPARPIRVVVPFVAGASYDTITRVVTDVLAESVGQPVVVDNRPGASGAIGADTAARATPDGHTLAMLGNNHTILQALRSKLSYDLFKDFKPVGRIAMLDNVIVVHPSVPAKSLKEAIALFKAHPGKYHYGSGGVAGSTHLAGGLFASLTQTKLVHVPYKGGGLAVTGLLGGEVQLMIVNMISARPQVQAGKMRALAVAAKQRSAQLANVPTAAEAGLAGYEVSQFYGFLAPAATSDAIVTKLSGELRRIVAEPSVKARLNNQGAETFADTPSDFAQFLRADVEINRKVAREANIRLE